MVTKLGRWKFSCIETNSEEKVVVHYQSDWKINKVRLAEVRQGERLSWERRGYRTSGVETVVIMLHSRKLSHLCCLVSHSRVTSQIKLPFSYSKMHYIIRRYRSSKLVKSTQHSKSIISEDAQKEVNDISDLIPVEPPEINKSYKIIKKCLPPLTKEKFIAAPVPLEIQTVVEHEGDHTPEIKVTSVNEVLERIVGEMYNKDSGILVPQSSESKKKNIMKGDVKSGKRCKVKFIPSHKNAANEKIGNKKKIVLLDSKERIEKRDSSFVYCCNSLTANNNSLSEIPYYSHSSKQENALESERYEDGPMLSPITNRQENASESERYEDGPMLSPVTNRQENASESERYEDGPMLSPITSRQENASESERYEDGPRLSPITSRQENVSEAERYEDGPKLSPITIRQENVSEAERCEDGPKLSRITSREENVSEAERCEDGPKLSPVISRQENASEAKLYEDGSTRYTIDTDANNLDKHVPTQALHDIRRNSIGIQMLSKGIFDQLFKEESVEDSQDAEDLQWTKEHLEAHGLWNKTPSVLPNVEIKLPELEGNDLDQHFRIIAEDQCFQYKELLSTLMEDIPRPPDHWEFTPGWTRYNSDGSCSPVDCPECSAIVFDVEVCVKEGNEPTLATAVSNKFWYSWCSESLINPTVHSDKNEVGMEKLIPFETSGGITPTCSHPARVVVGHNVSYDRLRIREQYLLEETRLRFLDTMSLHIAVSGLVSDQRAILMKNKSEKKVKLPWMFVGCQNSLDDVYKFYCRTEKGLEKSTRNVFVEGTLSDIREDFQNMMSYCASDVKATQMVLVKLLPLFFKRFPHPVTFSGMLEMGLTFLPVTENWKKYVEASESQYNQIERLLNEELVKQVQASLAYMKEKKYENDPWLWSLDWACPKGKVKKLPGYPNWYRKLCARTGEKEGTPEPENMSTSLQIVPKILRLTWNGFPLYYERKFGWGYLKPLYHSLKYIPQSEWNSYINAADGPVFPVKVLYEICDENTRGRSTALQDISGYDEHANNLSVYDSELDNKHQGSRKGQKGISHEEGLKDIGIPGVGFVPLPHKDGGEHRVGNPLAKDFLGKIEDGTLSSHVGDVAELVLKTNKSLSYWKNNRDRILSQMVVWNNHSFLPRRVTSSDNYRRENKYGAILPMVVTAGTITRRAVERTWMTASNAYADRIGSELKAMVEAPPGYKFVGADVDSQELWIASLLGDAYFTGDHGATALGWMTLQGKKSDGTDMHSHTAHSAGISRDHAKVINYGRIYGAGLRFIERLLKQYNPRLTDEETKRQAENLIAVTKGEKCWHLSKAGEELALELGHHVTEEPMSRKKIMKLIWQARENNYDTTFSDIVRKPPVWIGGSESHMFNCLEAIARCSEPKTPVLGARITRALEPQYVGDEFMTSRVNWVVQSSAVDYLHIMLVCMRWLFMKYGISGRFCISIHDEVRYLVAERDCHRAALALQITNLLTRAYFASRLGFKDLPQSVAFFSGVDIDQVLRKEPHLDCVTPSNPQGLLKGYNIKPGITLDIHEIITLTNGQLTDIYPECCEAAAPRED